MSRKKGKGKGQRSQPISTKSVGITNSPVVETSVMAEDRHVEGGFRLLELAGEHIWIATTALFIISFAVRLVLSFLSGPMTVTVMPDEVRYFHIARSIVEQGSILIRDMPTTFQKILYPLALTPAFFITENQMAQITIIRVINCLVMSSVVFPTMLLARKLTSRKAVVVLSLVFSIILPDMVFSTMVMSEVLQLPLVIWVFYILICAMGESELSKKRLILFTLFGFTTYLAYLNKEICAAFMISAAVMLAFEAVCDRTLLKRNAVSALYCAVGFFFIFIVMKLTVFRGVGNTYVEEYDLMSFEALGNAYSWYYLFYSAIILTVGAVASFYVLPVFFPMIAFKGMDKNNQRMYAFSILTLITIVGVVAYTVSIREDFGDIGNMTPQLHLRFVAYLAIPLVIQCFDFLLSKEPGGASGMRKQSINREAGIRERFSPVILVIIAVFCSALVFLMQRGTASGASIAHSSLKIMLELEEVNITKGGGELFVNFPWAAFKFLLLLLTISGIWLVIKGKKRHVLIILISFMLLVSVFDNFYAYREKRYLKSRYYYQDVVAHEDDNGEENGLMESLLYTKGVQYSNRAVDALIAVNDYIKGRPGNVIAYIPSQMTFLADIYLDARIFPADASFLGYAVVVNGPVRLHEFAIPDANGHANTWNRGFYSFDYIITLKDDNPFTNATVVYEQSPFVVLGNDDPSTLYVDIDQILRASGIIMSS